LKPIIAMLALSACASAPPEVTPEHKISVLQAQRDLIALEAEKNALESRLKDLKYDLMPKAQAELKRRMAAAAPVGYELQPDLTLKAVPEK
jgi:cell division protein FtsB